MLFFRILVLRASVHNLFNARLAHPHCPMSVIISIIDPGWSGFSSAAEKKISKGLLTDYRSRCDNDVAIGVRKVGRLIAPVAKRQWT